jgi:hypothetical protein
MEKQSKNLFFHVGTTQIAPRPPPVEVSRPQTNTHSVRLLCTSDQPVAEYATYQYTKSTGNDTAMLSAGIKSAIPAIERLQIYVLDRTVKWIGPKPHTDNKNSVSIKNEKLTDHLSGCQLLQKDSVAMNWL